MVAHTLRGAGLDASEDGTGRGNPIIAVHGTQDPCTSTDTAFALGRNSGQENAVAYGIRTANTSSNGWGIQEETTHTLDQAMGIAVAFAQNSRDEVRLMGGDGQIVGALAAEPGMKQTCYVAQPAEQPAIGWSEELTASVELAGTIRRGGDGGRHDGVMFPTMQLRRLTPRECEALQGFPPDYTLIPWRKKPAEDCPDGPRYKVLGNSWAVPNVRWIGRRIDAQLHLSSSQHGRISQVTPNVVRAAETNNALSRLLSAMRGFSVQTESTNGGGEDEL